MKIVLTRKARVVAILLHPVIEKIWHSISQSLGFLAVQTRVWHLNRWPCPSVSEWVSDLWELFLELLLNLKKNYFGTFLSFGDFFQNFLGTFCGSFFTFFLKTFFATFRGLFGNFFGIYLTSLPTIGTFDSWGTDYCSDFW